jgi:hypothetical protein
LCALQPQLTEVKGCVIMHKFIRLLVPTAVLLLAVAAVAAQNGIAEVIGGDEAAVRELLSRTLASYPAYEGSETIIQVSSLPEDLPFELDLSDDMRVIGSIQRGVSSPTEIYIDSAQPPEAVISFFAERFSSEEWKLVDGFPGGGFITTTLSDSAVYCNETLNTLVSINAFGYGEGMSDMRLYISPADNYPCAADGSFAQDPYRLLPQLETPEGVTLLGGGSGWGGSSGFQSVSTQAYLESDLPLDTITAAYNQQLEAFGWQAMGAESGEKLSWSGWTVEGDGQTWAGTLTLTASPTAANQYSATLSIQETAADS